MKVIWESGDGKFPKGCVDCPFIEYRRKGRDIVCECDTVTTLHYKPIYNIKARPVWCPLTTKDQYFEQIFFYEKATSHMEAIITGDYIPDDIKNNNEEQ
jgi:hypothetical protein